MPTSKAGALLQLVVGLLLDIYFYIGDRVDTHLIGKYQP